MSADKVVALPAPLSLEDEVKLGQKRTCDMFYSTQRLQQPEFPDLQKIRVYSKVVDEYQRVAVPVPPPAAARFASAASSSSAAPALLTSGGAAPLLLTDASSSSSAAYRPIGAGAGSAPIAAGAGAGSSSSAIVASGALSAVNDVVAALQARSAPKGLAADAASAEQYRKVEEMTARAQEQSRAIVARRAPSKIPTPKWHPPWKLMRVISGHLGWVRSIAVEPGNEWFATGAADRTIKIWDLASGTLKLTLTGHINTVRGIAVSSRHPYMFSAGEDKMVKCWDLETNKVIRHYHGHLSGVYALALHPTLDILFSGGRDSVCRVWDMRTKAQIHVLGGHENSVASILANSVDPQVITGGMDNQVRCWDLAAGKCRTVLTHHKKAIRGMASHPKEFAFVSGAADNLKKWALPSGDFVQNFTGHNSIVNCVAVNQDDVMVSGGDDGSLKFWDWGTGYSFSEVQSKVQPGSLDSEAGIYAMSFDQTGTRLLTCEADKSIKIWREDTDASPESHPVDMKGWTDFCRTHKYY